MTTIRRNLRRLTLATAMLVLLATAIAYLVAARSAAARASLTSAVRAAGYSCARNPAALLSPTAISSRMTVTLHVAERYPATTAIGQSPGPDSPVWFADINARLPGIPASFDPFDPSSAAAAQPGRVDQETTTIQAFTTARAATSFLRSFDPAAQPQGHRRAGTLRKLTQHARYSGHPGDLMLVVGSHIAGRDYPGDVQFVIQRRTVVTTIELVGGDALTPASQLRIAALAERTITRACPALPAH